MGILPVGIQIGICLLRANRIQNYKNVHKALRRDFGKRGGYKASTLLILSLPLFTPATQVPIS